MWIKLLVLSVLLVAQSALAADDINCFGATPSTCSPGGTVSVQWCDDIGTLTVPSLIYGFASDLGGTFSPTSGMVPVGGCLTTTLTCGSSAGLSLIYASNDDGFAVGSCGVTIVVASSVKAPVGSRGISRPGSGSRFIGYGISAIK